MTIGNQSYCLSQQQPKTLEHEVKYVFSNHWVTPVVRWLQHICRIDPEYPHNIVSSIYYDTKDWRFLQEKVNSDYLKTKLRVRWYCEPDNRVSPGAAFIELKSKVGAPRTKFRMKAPYASQWFADTPLEDQQLLEIPQLLRSQGVFLESPVFPAFIVQYERYRFIEGISGARVCVDCNISAPKVNSYMLPESHPLPIQTAVLEIKGHLEGLPNVLSQLTAFGCRKSSFSKYSACYQKIRRIAYL